MNGARPIDERQALSGCGCSDTVTAERTCSHDPLRLIQLHCSLYMPPRTQGRTSQTAHCTAKLPSDLALGSAGAMR